MVYVHCSTYWRALPYTDIQGSYAGARAAHMKVLYPDLVWGAIASSGTHITVHSDSELELRLTSV